MKHTKLSVTAPVPNNCTHPKMVYHLYNESLWQQTVYVKTEQIRILLIVNLAS